MSEEPKVGGGEQGGDGQSRDGGSGEDALEQEEEESMDFSWFAGDEKYKPFQWLKVGGCVGWLALLFWPAMLVFYLLLKACD
jgi:hypothetical protein